MLAFFFYLFTLTVVSFILFYMARKIFWRFFYKMLQQIIQPWNLKINLKPLISRISYFIPLVLILIGSQFISDVPTFFHTILIYVLVSCSILIFSLVITAFLDVIASIYQKKFKIKPITSYIQILKIMTYTVAVLFIFANLLNQSPLILLSSLGTMAAILILVFQDTLLSLIAGIQISTTDMVRVDDWIEIPNLNANGVVTDIALHTVTVRNWDNTIANIPIRKLVTDTFKNWRGIKLANSRRIKRALLIDQTTIQFINDTHIVNLGKLRLLKPYLNTKAEELSIWNNQLGEHASLTENCRKLTNIGTLRAYMMSFLKNHPFIRDDMTLLVRQLPSTPNGLPLEIYCFCKEINLKDYEAIQADIFDHFYAIMPYFNLRVFQKPTGYDIQHISNLKSK